MKVPWLALAVALMPGCYDTHQRSVDTARDAAPDCAAMDIHAPPGCTVGVPTYWSWSGTSCEGHICACTGRDCMRTFATEAACMNAFSRCAR